MKIKPDENLPLRLATLLKGLGHDVHTLHDELLLGHTDNEVWDNDAKGIEIPDYPGPGFLGLARSLYFLVLLRSGFCSPNLGCNFSSEEVSNQFCQLRRTLIVWRQLLCLGTPRMQGVPH
jgi:hypothetical protein